LTVSRQLGRIGSAGAYRASEADRCAWERAPCPKRCRLVSHLAPRWSVAETLALQWSLQRLAEWLKRELTITIATDVKVYFCDPRSPWQRGGNENTNGLLPQYFPKGKDLSIYSQAYLNEIARRLNQRPRKTLGFE
jgi:IS30 family transposase